GEIDSTEAESSNQNVDATAQGLIGDGIDGLGNSLGTVGIRPGTIHFGVGFVDGHLQRSMSHVERDELLPVFGPGQAAGDVESLVEGGSGQGSEQGKWAGPAARFEP